MIRSKYNSVFITGSASYDTIMGFPGMFKDYFNPKKLHQINISFALSDLNKYIGGTGINITYNLLLALKNNQLDKFPTLKLAASIGKDGKDILLFLKKYKFDTSHIIIDKQLYSSTGKVITDLKNNQIWGFYYGAGVRISTIDFTQLDNGSSLLVISANHPKAFIYYQQQAIKYCISYLYDPGMSLTWIKDDDLEKGVMNSTYLVGNDYEMAMITKRIKKTNQELLNHGIKIITTLGEKGVLYEEKAKTIKIPAIKVNKVVDPTGAGDAWRGGFIAGLELNYSIKDCLKLGNTMASFAIEKCGTVNHQPSFINIKKRVDMLK